MAERLDAPVALVGLIPSTYMVVYNHVQFCVLGLQYPLLTSSSTKHAHEAHTYMQAKLLHIKENI